MKLTRKSLFALKALAAIALSLAASSPVAAAGWTNRTPDPKTATNTPSARYWSAMAYDSARGKVVLFGGYTASGGSALGDTWEWDGSAWHDVSPSGAAARPTARYRHGMAYDTARGKTVLYGGQGVDAASSTWEWDGSIWTNVTPTINRPISGVDAMAYDEQRHKTVVYGDQITQEWDGVSWTRITPITPPRDTPFQDRAGTAMAYAGNGIEVLFGGTRESQKSLNDTWTFNGSSWVQKGFVVGAPFPDRRVGHVMAYDPAHNRTLLFGGHNFRETTGTNWSAMWEYNGDRWAERVPNPTPQPLTFSTMSYAGNGKVLLFGGQTQAGASTNDTWEYSGPEVSRITFNVTGPPTAHPGQDFLYKVEVSNAGAAAGNIWLGSVMPHYLTFQGLYAPGWAAPGAVPGQNTTLNFYKTIRPGTTDTFYIAMRMAVDAPSGAAVKSIYGREHIQEDLNAPSVYTEITTTVQAATETPSLVVTTVNDAIANDGETSLREALTYANSNPDPSTITFAPGLANQTLLLSSLDPVVLPAFGHTALGVTSPVTIQGLTEGKSVTIARDSSVARLRLFAVTAEGTLTLRDVTLKNGVSIGEKGGSGSDMGGGLPGRGGAIFNAGQLTIERCTLTDNEAIGGAGGTGTWEYAAFGQGGRGGLSGGFGGGAGGAAGEGGGGAGLGGAIYNDGGETRLTNVTVVDNSALGGSGAAEAGQGLGGGVFTRNGITRLTACTFSNNTAATGGSLYVLGDGIEGGQAKAFGSNLILANTPGGASDAIVNSINSGATSSSGEHNLIENNGSDPAASEPNDFAGVSVTADPMLGALGDNGGPTPTLLPLAGSPTIDAGAVVTNSDQRGVSRQGIVPDIGAVESLGAYENGSLEVSTLADEDDGDLSSGDVSLREALHYAELFPEQSDITFAPGLTGTIQLNRELALIRTPVSIQGPGARIITVRAADHSRIFQFIPRLSAPAFPCALSGLTVTNGSTAIINGADLTLINCAIVNNHAVSSGNTATYAGGVLNTGHMVIENCTLSGNTANVGSAILNSFDSSINVTSLIVRNSTISGNEVTGVNPGHAGGAIENANALGVGGSHTVNLVLENSTVAGNTATYKQNGVTGGIRIRLGSLILNNSLVAGNDNFDIKQEGGTVSRKGYNLIGNNASVESVFLTGALAGTAAAPLDPKLGPLANNGGPTDTRALLDDSPAINAADVNDAFTGRDQRGYPRARGARPDLGAYEADLITVLVKTGFPLTFAETAANPATRIRITRTLNLESPAVVTLSSSAPMRIKLPAKVTIPAGAASVDVDVTVVNDSFSDGPTAVTVRATSPGYAYLTDREPTFRITDDDGVRPSLAASFEPVFAEDRATTIPLVLTHDRSSQATEVPVTLQSNDARLSWPANLKFPVGSRKITVPVRVTRDAGIQGTRTAQIKISAMGFTQTSVTATIYDAEARVAVTVAPGSLARFSEGAGPGATKLRVTRNTPVNTAVQVIVGVRAGAGRITFPTALTIPAGKTFVDFLVAAVDNTVFEPDALVEIGAYGVGYFGSGYLDLTVIENDARPALSVALAPSMFLENRAGTVPFTVSHNLGKKAGAIALNLKATDPRLSWPANPVIPAGSNSVVIPLTVTPTAAVEGSVTSSLAVSSAGFAYVVAPVTIYDAQSALSLAAAPGFPTSFSESAGPSGMKIRLSRNTPTSAAVTARLSFRSGGDLVSVPQTVTIPAGKVFVDFLVGAVDNSSPGAPTQRVVLDARTEGYPTAGTIVLGVSDDDAPAADLAAPASPFVLSSVSASAAADTLTLTFTGPLFQSATAAASYTVTVNGNPVTIDAVSLRGGQTVVLQLDSLSAGDNVAFSYRLRDSSNRPLQGAAQAVAK